MSIKSILALIIGVPLMILILTYGITFKDKTQDQQIAELSNIIAEEATPWWVDIVQTLAGYGTIGAFMIIGVLYLAGWLEK